MLPVVGQFQALQTLDLEYCEKLERPEMRFLRGDSSADGSVSISDATQILNYLFLRGDPVSCEKAADADDDGRMGLVDVVRIVLHLFRARTLPAPSRSCGPDPTPDSLGCNSPNACS